MLSSRPEHGSCIRASFHFIFSFVLFGKHTHSKNHVLSSHSVVSSVFQRTRQFKSFSESKQIYWSIATANTFILVFGNISNIFCSIFQGVSFNYHQRNVRYRSRAFRSRSCSFSQVSEVTVSTTSLLKSSWQNKIRCTVYNNEFVNIL